MSDYVEYTVMVWASGTKRWYLNGKQHREDGPAIECADGTKRWYLNGELHREDGPAEEWASGTKYWYLNGKQLTEEEFNERTNKPCVSKVVTIEGVEYNLVPTRAH